jgi:hypothetical protein
MCKVQSVINLHFALFVLHLLLCTVFLYFLLIMFNLN